MIMAVTVNAQPSAVTITSPANNTGVTFNTKPWICFKATDASHQINDVRIQIATDAGFGSVVYDRTASSGHQTKFYPLPAASNAIIRHRVDTALTPGVKYVRVMLWCSNAVNRTQSINSGWSTGVQFTISAEPSWTDGTITAGSTLVKAAHFTELRTQINNVRKFRGDTDYTWTNSTLTGGTSLIKASDLSDLRTAITTPFNTATGTDPVFTDSTITSGTTLIRKIHIDELRSKTLLP